MTPRRAELRALANELRRAHARLGSADVAARLQETIVRLEDLLVSPTIDPVTIDELYELGHQLLDECARLGPQP